jgi:hypothetical protein
MLMLDYTSYILHSFASKTTRAQKKRPGKVPGPGIHTHTQHTQLIYIYVLTYVLVH